MHVRSRIQKIIEEDYGNFMGAWQQVRVGASYAPDWSDASPRVQGSAVAR